VTSGSTTIWVEVVISKRDRCIETRKYCREVLACQASGPNFLTGMVHTALIGPAEDKPADKWN